MGTFTANRSDCGAPKQHPELEEAVFHAVEEDATSTQNIVRRLDVDHRILWDVIDEQQLHSYHYRRVQALRTEDFVP